MTHETLMSKIVKIFQGPTDGPTVGPTDRPNDGPTDRQTDRPTDMTTPRSSDPELKKGFPSSGKGGWVDPTWDKVLNSTVFFGRHP